MKRVDDFATKALEAALKKRFPQIGKIGLYCLAERPARKAVYIKTKTKPMPLYTSYWFDESEELIEFMEKEFENKLEALEFVPAKGYVNRDDLKEKLRDILMTENRETEFLANGVDLQRCVDRIVALEGGNTVKAWRELGRCDALDLYRRQAEAGKTR